MHINNNNNLKIFFCSIFQWQTRTIQGTVYTIMVDRVFWRDRVCSHIRLHIGTLAHFKHNNWIPRIGKYIDIFFLHGKLLNQNKIVSLFIQIHEREFGVYVLGRYNGQSCTSWEQFQSVGQLGLTSFVPVHTPKSPQTISSTTRYFRFFLFSYYLLKATYTPSHLRSFVYWAVWWKWSAMIDCLFH